MKFLIFADEAPNLPIPEIIRRNPGIDFIVTLGDLEESDIADLAKIEGIPKIGVYGNHCDGRYMDKLGIENLHMKLVTMKGVSFFWYQGCVKYKESPMMSTQEYCSAVMSAVHKVDILVTHCPPRGINDNHDPSHYGFEGLRTWVEREKPRFVFHGHTYDFGKFVRKFEDTGIVYVNGWKVVEIASP